MNVLQAFKELNEGNCQAISRRDWQIPTNTNKGFGKAVRVIKSKQLDKDWFFYKVGLGGFINLEGVTFDERDVLSDDWYTIKDEKEWVSQQLQ